MLRISPETADVEVTDDLLMDFFTKELPKTNKGSMGRSLRAVRYLSAYLKNNGNAELLLDFTQLTARGHHVRVIPPYSQKEINRAVSSIDITTPEGLRDYAIMLLAFDTGLRSVDIRTLCLGISTGIKVCCIWHNQNRCPADTSVKRPGDECHRRLYTYRAS